MDGSSVRSRKTPTMGGREAHAAVSTNAPSMPGGKKQSPDAALSPSSSAKAPADKRSFSRAQHARDLRASTNMHYREQPSPLSMEAPRQDYRGFLNLLVIILVVMNARLVLENITKYGLLISFSGVSKLSFFDSWPCYTTLVLIFITGPLIAFAVEDAATPKPLKNGSRSVPKLSRSAATYIHVANTCAHFFLPLALVWFGTSSLISNYILAFMTILLTMKLISFAHVSTDMRDLGSNVAVFNTGMAIPFDAANPPDVESLQARTRAALPAPSPAPSPTSSVATASSSGASSAPTVTLSSGANAPISSLSLRASNLSRRRSKAIAEAAHPGSGASTPMTSARALNAASVVDGDDAAEAAAAAADAHEAAEAAAEAAESLAALTDLPDALSADAATLNACLLSPMSPAPAPVPLTYTVQPYLPTVKHLYYYLAAPTLVYQPWYPRSARVRKAFVLRRLAELVFTSCIIVFVIEQYVKPTLLNALVYFDNGDVARIIERVLKLCIPNTIVWLLIFYALFHSYLNLVAELLRFGDRVFYRDWWNSGDLGVYWRLWNRPVHDWLVKHVYYPALRAGVSSGLAQILVFFVSALLHEVIVSVPCHVVTAQVFIGMFTQVPVISATQWVYKKSNNPVFGNVVFWCAFCIFGQPLLILIYGYKYLRA